LRKTQEVIWDTRNPNKIFGIREIDFWNFLINGFSSTGKENNRQKNLENSQKTLKMDKHIVKDIHILKLNILGCDSWYSASGVNYMICKAKIKERLTWFDRDKYF
jgi:hypothetical protein